MSKDRYSALWVSHTSLSDYLNCPRAYYLKNIYKDPKTNHKIQISSPSLALGASVHEVVESLSTLPYETRFEDSLVLKFDEVWQKYQGQKSGFKNLDQEYQFKERGKAMLRRVMEHPGPLKNQAVKINQDLPSYWISEEDNIILCGKIDWLEYLPEIDSVHILDFKTGKKKENKDSLQLPIYLLLARHCQKRPVSKASYWYLETDNLPLPVELPSTDQAETSILKIAREIKLAKKLSKFDCPQGDDGCPYCQPFELILNHQAHFVGESEYHQDMYVLPEINVVSDEEDSYLI